jgi:glycosyltransferase A (GT-A) superfamily protein (DUF2064 family)
MAPTIIILSNGLTHTELAERLGPAATSFVTSFVHDTIAVARSLRDTRVVVRYGPAMPTEALVGIEPTVRSAPLRSFEGRDLAMVLAEATAEGDPAVLVSDGLPHLPPWRLRDALTHLQGGADTVIGPSDTGSWYLIGVRAAPRELLRHIPGGGEPASNLARVAGGRGRRVALLPPWFGVETRADVHALADALRTMPRDVAARTRSLFEAGPGFARALGS